ncbi:MAG TPA: hypothetical protein VGG13_03410 [Candidatus Saccharimonadales bacterium]
MPHFIKGITGERHQTPFGRLSSAIVNVIWGWFNLAVAVVLLHFAHPWAHLYRASVIAALLMAILLAYGWAAHPSTTSPKNNSYSGA